MCDPGQAPDRDGARIEDVISSFPSVPAVYRVFHDYLKDRYADTVVLTFDEIEDLLGFPLPDAARLRAEWWANDDEASGASIQSRAWMQASRTAKPNLFARTVVFERVSRAGPRSAASNGS
jgi:hypothetical protein